ncbi:MAG: hypothetical protein CSA60_00815 [Neptuniibacter caesariensis]|uniref:Uncharacterized protein n=1 Tax=Neptuniibacter caesariensis TaxID=207954 RepID=A0A2G6JPM3_NEPCE|nr:MAG: hypothetical protein CSA60_00815 [Neptuniibacter caesariensis]
MNHYRKLLGLLLSLSLISPLPVSADEVQTLVNELQQLAEKSRQERAADRWLQNALEDLVDKYNFPWKNSLLQDDFSDGDYQHAVTWSVGSGEFWVDRRLGLRSRVEPTYQPVEPQEEPGRSLEKDLTKALVGALLKETLGDKSSSRSESRTPPSPTTTPASIRTQVSIPTTFAIESMFGQNNRPGESGQFEWVVMQEDEGTYGYKVVVTTGETA